MKPALVQQSWFVGALFLFTSEGKKRRFLFTLDDGGVCDGVKGQCCCFCLFSLAVLQGSSPDNFSLKNLSIISPYSFLVYFFFYFPVSGTVCFDSLLIQTSAELILTPGSENVSLFQYACEGFKKSLSVFPDV